MVHSGAVWNDTLDLQRDKTRANVAKIIEINNKYNLIMDKYNINVLCETTIIKHGNRRWINSAYSELPIDHRFKMLEYRYNLGLYTLWSETEIACALINTDIAKTVGPTVLTDTFWLGPTVHIGDGVGPSDGLFPLQDVNKNEYLILIKYQTLLKSKHNLFCLTETRVCIVLELIMALEFS